ncbi:hypothetical protein G7Y89_g3735 [Cudoniella acicularis]|uniref:Uncharacterized protein n=1 Tax=Cudoniella acicularis TaxID=354080 RepID=A0A8H4RQT0_9HELO|nr:hypothetical protein G7Y89_g3735 [Cudoniella acicularis]
MWVSDRNDVVILFIPVWRSDLIHIVGALQGCGPFRDVVTKYKYREPGVELWAREILEDVGYSGGVSVPAILSLLRDKKVYRYIEEHLINSIVLKRLYLEGDPEDSLLPFMPEVHRWLRGFYKSLEGMKYKSLMSYGMSVPLICILKVSPELSSILSKILFQLANEYAKEHAWDEEGTRSPIHLFNSETHVRLGNRVSELFSPIAHPEWLHPRPNVQGKIVLTTGNAIDTYGLDEAVDFHLRMMASRQRFELRWGHNTTADGKVIDCGPVLYSHAGPDGVPLSESKQWCEFISEDMIEGVKLNEPLNPAEDGGPSEPDAGDGLCLEKGAEPEMICEGNEVGGGALHNSSEITPADTQQ